MAPGPALDAGLCRAPGAWGSPGELGFPSWAVLCAGGAAEGAGRQRLQASSLGSSSLCPKLLLWVSPGLSPAWEEEEEGGLRGLAGAREKPGPSSRRGEQRALGKVSRGLPTWADPTPSALCGSAFVYVKHSSAGKVQPQVLSHRQLFVPR